LIFWCSIASSYYQQANKNMKGFWHKCESALNKTRFQVVRNSDN